MLRIERKNIHAWLATILFVMLAFGYVFSSFVPTFFDLPSRPFNLSFRLVYLLLSFYLIFAGRKVIFETGLSIPFWSIAIFLVLYSVRILHDTLIQGIVLKNSIFFLYSFSFGGSFIPFFALAIHAKKIDYSKLLKYSYYMLFLSSILLFVLIFKRFGAINIEMFIQRMSFVSADGKSETINPITLSFYGTALSLLSLYFIMFSKSIRKSLLFIGFIFGGLLLIFGASRGPQVNFFICFIFLLFTFIFKFRKSLKTKFISGVSFILILGLLINISQLIDLEKIGMYNRFVNFGKDASSDTSMREMTWRLAIQDFVESPIIGKAYVETLNMTYPHNIYLELLMAMGLVGVIFLVTPIAYFVFYLKRDSTEKVGVFLLFLMALVAGLFSGCLFINPFLWSILGIMIGFSYKKTERKVLS